MQSDLQKDREKNGIHDFMRILELMPDDFEMIEMGIDDICRSGLVRNYLIAKNARNVMFTHCNEHHAKFGRLNRCLDEGVRFYQVDDQTLYPSVTSVISHITKPFFDGQRESSIEEEANR